MWAVLKERSPVRVWGIVWALMIFLFSTSRMALYWHIGLFDWLVLAFALQQLLTYARQKPEFVEEDSVTSTN